MTFDTKVPRKLKSIQQWFGSIIGRPLTEEDKVVPVAPSGELIENEAGQFILPSPTLHPAQRIQIYNQQYWWRLLSALQDSFPLVTRLFGYHDFNRSIAIPYLVKFPPHSWSLAVLGDRLPQWVEEDYNADDKELVLNAARLDCAYNESFIAPQYPPILSSNLPKEGDPSSLFEHFLYLQKHVKLFEMRYDLCRFRLEFLKQDVEYWFENDFPPLKKDKKYYTILYRNKNNEITWEDVTETEYRLLGFFQRGGTIDNLCQWVETQQDPFSEEAANRLQDWFRDWIVMRWLTLEKVNI